MEQRIYADNRNEQALMELHMADTTPSERISRAARAEPLLADRRPAPQPGPAALAPASQGYLLLKRAFDIVASLLLLGIFFLPLFIVALCIRWESPGPAIHRRRVLARQSCDDPQATHALETFDAFKLRTMIPDAEEYLSRHPHLFESYQKDWKLEHDPRITRLGAFLRTTSIDELPQLLNVLKGEMSLIGPRMITVPELARYGADAPLLLSVKPGLTGLWQVNGRQELTYEERVRLDMVYVQSRSVQMDLQILLKTVKCVLLRRGAY
ncbi:MAG: sugar transferase [Armatimonadetes bacterium]|nr:sugar transferase [Armatimonadota bacterium]